MVSATGVLRLALRARRRRVLGLVAFAAAFLAAGSAAALLFRDPAGHVGFEALFRVGGYAGVSAVVLIGWLVGRYPLIATLVLLAGVVSHDREAGYGRLYAVRPVSSLRVYGTRIAALVAIAFALSAVLLPTFDLLMLGQWAGPATFVLILAHVLVYGGLTALLSVWTRSDVWIVLFLALLAMVWHAVVQSGAAPLPPGPRELITFLLPPQGALAALEGAFAEVQPIPWDAFAYAAGYGVVMFALAGVSLAQREI